MKYSPQKTGFVQAVALSAYIGLFANSAFRIQDWAHAHNISPHPIGGIMLFLFAFVISALISGIIVFAYPIMLFFDGHKWDALKVVLWSEVWLALIFALIATSIFFSHKKAFILFIYPL